MLLLIHIFCDVADSFLLNMNNNATELYNSILGQFVGGIRINFSLGQLQQFIIMNLLENLIDMYIKKKTKPVPGFSQKRLITPSDEDYDLPSEAIDLEAFDTEKTDFLKLLSADMQNIELLTVRQYESLF